MTRCPVCRMTNFDSVDEMRSHRRVYHGDLVVNCTCGRTFLEQAYKEQHLRDLGERHGKQKTRRRRRPRRSKANGSNCNQRDIHPAFLMGGERGSSSAGHSISASSSLPSDLYYLDSSNLERFIAEEIQADDCYLTSCKAVVHELAGSLSLFSPREIIKSGSLGKGTSVKGKSDVDLIMMLNDYEDVEELMDEMPNVLKKLKRFLKNNTRAAHKVTTRFSVQVMMPCRSGHQHEVDILPGVDLIGKGESTRDIYRKMRGASDELIHEYSVSLSPLQLDIIGQLPTKVKNLIRVVKYWKNEKLKGSSEPEMPSFADKKPGQTAWPSSYALELVVMNAWIDAGKPGSFNMTRAIHSVLTSLTNHAKFKVLLHGIMKYEAHMARHGPGPYIMDPANPYNDMYHGLVNGKAFDWGRVAAKASEWLRKDLFAGVSDTQHRW